MMSGEHRILDSTDEHAGLTMVLLLRRLGALSDGTVNRFEEIVKTSDCSRAIIFNKTNEPIDSHVQTDWSESETQFLVIDRPRDEPIFKTLSLVRSTLNGRVIQFHDDDLWEGSVKFDPANRAAVLLASLDRSDPHKIWSVQNTLFGAIRGDIWDCFASYCSLSPVASNSLDHSLNLLVENSGDSEWLPEYVYLYDTRHWSNREVIEKNNAKAALVDGWGKLSSPQASQLHMFIDKFAILHLGKNQISGFAYQSALEEIWNSRPTSVMTRLPSKFVKLIPDAAKLSIIHTRTKPLSQRIGLSVKALVSPKSATADSDLQSLLFGERLLRNQNEIASWVIPSIAAEVPELGEQCVFWLDCISSD